METLRCQHYWKICIVKWVFTQGENFRTTVRKNDDNSCNWLMLTVPISQVYSGGTNDVVLDFEKSGRCDRRSAGNDAVWFGYGHSELVVVTWEI